MNLALPPFYGSAGALEAPDLRNFTFRPFQVLLAAVADRPVCDQIVVSKQKTREILQSVPRQAGFDEKIFDVLVSLKVATSQYAMHLSNSERARLFARLDELINVDDWHEEDTLPSVPSFLNFLKWIIFSKNFEWSSIGVASDGNILVAWTRSGLVLTANFFPQNSVTWTAAVESSTTTRKTSPEP
jgi:hypothetical protein